MKHKLMELGKLIDVKDDINLEQQATQCDALKQVPFFSEPTDAMHEFVAELAMNTSTYWYQPGKVLIQEGDTDCDEMYILLRGSCEVFSCGQFLGRIENDVIGEIGILDLLERRTSTVQCATACQCMKLSRQVMVPILAKYPDARLRLLELARTRLTALSEAINGPERVSKRPCALQGGSLDVLLGLDQMWIPWDAQLRLAPEYHKRPSPDGASRDAGTRPESERCPPPSRARRRGPGAPGPVSEQLVIWQPLCAAVLIFSSYAYIFWKSGRATEARDLRMAKELQLRKLRGQQLVRGPDAGADVEACEAELELLREEEKRERELIGFGTASPTSRRYSLELNSLPQTETSREFMLIMPSMPKKEPPRTESASNEWCESLAVLVGTILLAAVLFKISADASLFAISPIFQDAPIPLVHALSKRLVDKTFQDGEVIMQDGEKFQPQRDFVYFIVKGEVEVWKDGNFINLLKEGETFGEGAALRKHATREATVKAKDDVKCRAGAEAQGVDPEMALDMFHPASRAWWGMDPPRGHELVLPPNPGPLRLSGHFSLVLEQALDRFEAGDADLRPHVVHSTEEFLTIHDGYPKAAVHLLVLPRTRVASLAKLTPEHLPMLRRLCGYVAWLLEQLGQQDGVGWTHGLHSVPSLKQLHVHVMTMDFCSPCLKNAKHFCSFLPPFLVSLDEAVRVVSEGGFVARSLQELEEGMKKRRLCCHRPTCCDHGFSCSQMNSWYSQCVPAGAIAPAPKIPERMEGDECYEMFSELSFNSLVQSFPSNPDSQATAYVNCKLCSQSGMRCAANVHGGRTQLIASHIHVASDGDGVNGAGPPVINFCGDNSPGMISDGSPYKTPCAHYTKGAALMADMRGNFIDGKQNSAFTLWRRLREKLRGAQEAPGCLLSDAEAILAAAHSSHGFRSGRGFGLPGVQVTARSLLEVLEQHPSELVSEILEEVLSEREEQLRKKLGKHSTLAHKTVDIDFMFFKQLKPCAGVNNDERQYEFRHGNRQPKKQPKKSLRESPSEELSEGATTLMLRGLVRSINLDSFLRLLRNISQGYDLVYLPMGTRRTAVEKSDTGGFLFSGERCPNLAFVLASADTSPVKHNSMAIFQARQRVKDPIALMDQYVDQAMLEEARQLMVRIQAEQRDHRSERAVGSAGSEHSESTQLSGDASDIHDARSFESRGSGPEHHDLGYFGPSAWAMPGDWFGAHPERTAPEAGQIPIFPPSSAAPAKGPGAPPARRRMIFEL
ncbi:unnamed protein product [Effrenium voratum]|nr:unnamed protein product [Effrenium voratum]